MQSINTRLLAYEILFNVFYENKFSNQELAFRVDKVPMSDADRRFTRTLVYGVIENTLWLEWVIEQLSSVKLKKIDKKIMVLLKLGIYQMAFLDKVPESAAVNETVKIAKKVNFKSSGFVNAILRGYSRQRNELVMPNRDQNLSKYLSVKYSHPIWLVERWLEQFGVEHCESLLCADNETPKVSLRVNLCECDVEKAKSSLSADGYELKVSEWLDYALLIETFGSKPLHETEAFKLGWVTVQDVSSMLAAEILNPEPDEVVLDCCSAPGGKTTHLAEKMNRLGKLTARDVSEDKLLKINENLLRLRHDFVILEIADAAEFKTSDKEKYDKILIDAPCSGLGIIRRKPEIKLNRSREDIKSLAKIQESILDNMSIALKPGGEMVYSTCTIDPEENCDRVNDFLKKHPEFEVVSIEDRYSGFKDDNGFIQIYQKSGSLDGFFIAKLRKAK